MTFDCIVIGAGASGLFCSVQLGRMGKRVLLIEHTDFCGKKLAITGKGRCNVTNDCDSQTVMNNIPRNPRFMFSALDAFAPQAFLALLRLSHRRFGHLGDERKAHVRNRRAAVEAALLFHLQDDVLGHFGFIRIKCQLLFDQGVALDQLAYRKPHGQPRRLRVILNEVRDAVQAAVHRAS